MCFETLLKCFLFGYLCVVVPIQGTLIFELLERTHKQQDLTSTFVNDKDKEKGP